MKNKLLIFTSLLIWFSGCKKDAANNQSAHLPISNFSISASILNNIITAGTYDQIQITNNSSNNNSSLWNFGNDSTSKLENPGLSYTKSGTYIVTLTVQNSFGQKSSTSKTVKILDRIIKKVVIRSLQDLNGTSNLTLSKLNVWAVIKLGKNNFNYPLESVANSSFNAPIVYQSPIISKIDSSNIPYTFTVPNKIVLDFPALAILFFKNLGYKGIGYGFELYTQNGAATYLLSSSYQYFYTAQVGGINWPVADIEKNIFIARYANIDLVCDYE